ncbi:hypothetical protein ACT3HK_11790 [Thermolongibacillus altinsuensis]
MGKGDVMKDIPFSEQVRILRREVAKVFDYVAINDFYSAKMVLYDGDWSKKNIEEVLMKANYNGAIARITYYKYVHQFGFDPRALWDALILEWQLHFVWLHDFEKVIKEKEFQEVLNRFRYPELVVFGLIGGGLDKLKKMGEEFSTYMDELKEKVM